MVESAPVVPPTAHRGPIESGKVDWRLEFARKHPGGRIVAYLHLDDFFTWMTSTLFSLFVILILPF